MNPCCASHWYLLRLRVWAGKAVESARFVCADCLTAYVRTEAGDWVPEGKS